MKTFLQTIVALLLVLSVTPAARAETKKNEPKHSASAEATSSRAPRRPFWRVFSRAPKLATVPAPVPVAARAPKPKPAASVVVRRSLGQRSSQNASATRVVPATAPLKVTPTSVADVLAKPPAPTPVETGAIQRQYSPNTTLGRAMRDVLEGLESQSTQPTAVVEERIVARVTAFHGGDCNTDSGKTNTPGVRLQRATETQIGVAAGPAKLLGSYAVVTIDGKEYRYLIADIGSAVEKRTASGGQAPVIDLYAPGGERWERYKPVQIVKITGAAHMLLQDIDRRDEFLRRDVFQRALSLARRS